MKLERPSLNPRHRSGKRSVRRWWWVLLPIGLACAPALPPGYQRARAAAERAYVHGRYQEAARHWLRASREADRPRDRCEASYRAAVSLQRAGRYDGTAQLYREIARQPHCARAARAAFALAKLEIKHGEQRRGYQMLQRAVHEHPDSGLAPHALRQYLRWLQQREGTASVLSYLDQTLAQVRSEELTEHLHYAYAGALADLGRTRAARDRYLYVAKRFPYPHGALWDDALWHASHLEEKLGRYRAAIRHLKRMLAEREPPSAPGTYQRPRYAESQFRIAVLYRDQLHDLDAAYREFWRVYRDHADSRLRDDALWEAALAARARGKRAHTCAALERLLLDFPDSRYTPCLHWLCARLRHDADRSCRSYLRQQIREGLD